MKHEMETNTHGKYIYGIIRNNGSLDLGAIGIGEEPKKVYGVNFRDICAVVSNSPVIEYQPSKSNLLTHEKVLEEIMKQYTVLPVQFSTISPEHESHNILKILEENYEQYSLLLDKMEDKKEMGLKIVAYENEFIQYILQKYKKIKRMRDQLAESSEEKIQAQRIEVGRMVTEAVQKEIENYKNYILNKLNPLAEEVKVNNPFGEMMILNAAFLIKNTHEPEFDKAVNELYEELAQLMKFKYVGTIPPYNFVNININKKGD
ncbi:MAG: GvpL/GvpF family gas vesicle protein [Bacteroidales bacterium]|nr:GvpL/GvpF family gas vesicle protein [Bacteroidales bacterium]MCF8338281.1 GvpL/GvpF family gas vesicle protein [Bacteroidales bacterium]